MHLALRAGKNGLLQVGTLSLLSLAVQQAQAACVLTPGPGVDAYVCDSGSSPVGLTDLLGNNILTLPIDGTGTINGNIVTGAGTDLVDMNSGRIVGSVTQSDGADRFRISAGAVTGAVSQGNGIDDFVMSGGQIQSLAQGDGRDTFLMTGGTIVGAFEDGDVAQQTSGTIGRVDMKLDNNIYDMSGGSILGNLVTGFGTDRIIVTGGTIGGNISVSGGDDRITVSGGVINGEIRASVGNDTFNWLNGGQIKSAVLMGDGNDTALLSGLTESLLSATPSIDGGLGNDQLTFDNTTSNTASRYIGWETVNLNNNSHFDLAGDFFLGDSASNAGTVSIDNTSVLAVTQGSIRPYTAGQRATLINAGTIDMTTGSNSAADSLTVYGNYVGNNGQLWLQTVLGDDTSATDKLVVSDGSISGNTQLAVTNLSGLGGLTQNNGIEVVQALNGAVSTTDAFALKGSVSAGAYEYYLFKGGVTAGSENNWYLRSSVAAVQPPVVPPPTPVPQVVVPVPPIPPTPPVVAPDEPPVEPPTSRPVAPVEPTAPPLNQIPAETSPEPAVSTPPLPTAVAGADPIPLYRLEVPVYSVVVPAAQLMTLQALGTFHDRQGEQSLLSETGAVPAGWGRAYGRDFNKSWTGTVSPSFDGSTKGYQVGHDLYASETSGGQIQRFGLFVGQSRLQGDVKGFAEGFQDRRSGRVELDGDNFGAYWTLTDPTVGWYVDLVAMGTRLDGDNKSDRGVKMDSKGHALALSAEAGYPIAISEHWVVEPQVQVINQQIDMDSQNDGISKVSFDSQDYWTGRLGARLKGRYLVQNTPIEPYVRANAWRTFGGSDTVTYDDVDRIKSDHKSSSADLGVGVVARLSSTVSVYLAADYNTNLDTNALEGVSGNAGVRVSW
ncbi:autotransporter outer membrane beta-barrel domain-containing protein [Pseudomonas sp. BF-R-30]|uniref:autotransporter outer membrane beta-barrel domain-containing protein n=1 Tax=Pseudomonas sp. BF-R-30 TaxID=2832384 RepID=UPI001CBAD564|nr:autotransporter outer membrane beta-barrel domain-containing protein [Pseudomonas sp. BF-R-30]